MKKLGNWREASRRPLSEPRPIVWIQKSIEQRINALSTGLRKEGLRVLGGMKYKIINLSPETMRDINENHSCVFATIDVPTSYESASCNNDLISSTISTIEFTSYYQAKGTISTSGHRLRLFLHATPQQKELCQISLTLPFEIQPSPLFIRDLPSYFTAVSFRHAFTGERAREGFAGVAAYRLPSAAVDAENESFVEGKKTTKGIDTVVHLNLQEPSTDRHLKCYRVEIFEGGQKDMPLTKEVVPDSIWQPQEGHYCMIGENGYPLLPVEFEHVARLTMHISQRGSNSTLTDLLGDVPLTFDGSNQWYAAGQLGKGRIELLHMPTWEKNTALVYFETSQRLSYGRLATAAETLVAMKKDLTHRLAA